MCLVSTPHKVRVFITIHKLVSGLCHSADRNLHDIRAHACFLIFFFLTTPTHIYPVLGSVISSPHSLYTDSGPDQ